MGTKGKGKDHSSIYEPGQDLRLDFIFEYVTRCFKIKQDKWIKLLTTEDYRRVVVNFLDQAAEPALVFSLSNSGILTATQGYTTVSKMKSCYFIKKQFEQTAKDDPTFKDNLIYGDLSHQLLENLVTDMEEVISPITWVDMNDNMWPEQVVTDSKERSQIISNTLYSLKGQLKGKTWLPVPMNLQEIAGKLQNGEHYEMTLEIKKQAEAVVLKWSHQVSEVLHRDPAELFEAGKHPTPVVELRFWESRVDDLQCIYTQLQEDKIKVVNLILEKTKSRYWGRYKHMSFNVESALTESKSILTFFQPLRHHIDSIASASFDSEIQDLIRPMMHTICLMWVYSPHYRLSQRIIVLFRGICNLLIDSARSYLGGSLIFQLEPEEGFVKLKLVLEVLQVFKELYNAHKTALPHYFEPDQEVVPWDFLSHLIFARLDSFLLRMQQLETLFETTVDFYKLDKMEIGGSRGRHLGNQIIGIFDMFTDYFQKFSSISYDCCDPEDETFLKDYHIFLEKSKEIDFRISYALIHAIQDCHTPESAYKLIMIFGPLLHRTIIKEDFLANFPHYLKLIESEVKQVMEMFEEQIKSVDISKRTTVNRLLPPYSASIHWVKDVKDRLETFISQFQSLELDDVPFDLIEAMLSEYRSCIKYLSKFQEKTFQEWTRKISHEMPIWVKKNILMRDSENKIIVNGSLEISSLLKEVKYLTMAGYQNFPLIATVLYKKKLEFRRYTTFLHKICKCYNEIHACLTSVERNLISNQLKQIEDIVTRGETGISWRHDADILNYIQLLLNPLENLKFRLEKSQLNCNLIHQDINSWKTEPLFSRIDHQNDYRILDVGPESQENRDKTFEFISSISNDIHQRCRENRDFLVYTNKDLGNENKDLETESEDLEKENEDLGRKNKDLKDENKDLKDENKDRENENKDLEKESEDLEKENKDLEKKSKDLENKEWIEYLKVIDQQIINGLVKVVAASLGYLLDHTDFNPTSSTLPLFEIQMNLETKGISYDPPLDDNLDDSFLDRIQGILWTIFQPAALVSRVCPTAGEDYLDDILHNEDLMGMKNEFLERVQNAIKQALKYTERMNEFSYIWEEDRAEHLRQFLKFGHKLSQEELDMKELGEIIPEIPPTISQFQQAIDKYEALLKCIENFETEKVFDLWLLLDLKPFVNTLRETAEQWSLMFKQHLIDTVVGGLAELETFILENEKGMMQPLVEGDLQALISVMGILQQIKARTKTVETMFEPAKEYIELLKKYDYELPETVFIQLEELPVQWQALLKQTINVKMIVAPLQHSEVSSIKKRIADFDGEQLAYRDVFLGMTFFDINCPFPFKEINLTENATSKCEQNFQAIKSAARLFEVLVPEPKALRQCRKEIRFAKQLWDYTELVNTIIDDWKMSPWRVLNTENMDLECKRLAKEVKAMDKDVKPWNLFLSLEVTIRNIVSSLKSVGELQNPNIKDRHWQELLESTKIIPRFLTFLIDKFVRDERTTFADLYGLGLQNYEEEVKNVVDKAVKESSIEKTLKEFALIWGEQTYDFEIHSRTQVKLIKPSEDLIEILEDNQVQLQTIAMSKYIAFFKEEVDYWQNLLLQADNVLSSLVEVQRTWCHLESIFKASEDIRMNLPEDSARFDGIDRDFKASLSLMYTTTNVIQGTNQPQIYSEIQRLHGELSLCEKALAEYLETKRLKFPRFYFVSSADLLDILSTGDEPKLVGRHLPKLFDSIAGLIFPEADVMDKNAHSMKARDGEIVRLHEICNCGGAVEDWLNRLESSMRTSIRLYMNTCVHAYGEKSREKWIQDFPAQVALCGTQIWWTTEVTAAFCKLEDGNETALKDYFKKQVNQLNTLISLLVGELPSQERQKIMTICTIDVHSRDVVGKLIQTRIETGSAFQWQSQLRHRWDESEEDCFSNICDAQLRYLHEYLGNTPRLVITPLTDRCYITLTQSLHLIMGGAPAGPAGTGKTETTKDLGRALGVMVYVFNCSEQMDYRSVGSIFKGLSMTGAWGCFDEFNRISVEVLSVVAVQVKSIQDAIKDKKSRFSFMGEEIGLTPSVGIFITMNPGYAGRSELPENLKVLFRPCAMVVPDFELICEIMLVAEGFQEARVLARKFITLYTLCKELLSKQDHYDWGLRAIKSVLVVAGSLKRGDSARPEGEVLMRALRDFNIPKIISEDVPVFMGLIGDLFPALDVPRKRDVKFETIVKSATKELILQPEENFILKVVQLQELMEVRHSVFIVGDAGTGKTQVWKTFYKTYQIMGNKAVYHDLNPKAVTNDELFGIINPSSREWKDGIFSVLMRDLANMAGDGPKWIILDGDIDPMWIESLNTVMDDNKVLTLASNERISLTKSMRLIFEIYTLKHATPATVSRAGILYLNPQDVNWNAYISSWLNKRSEDANLKACLSQLFEKYIPSIMESMKGRFKKIIPLPEISHIQLLCNFLEALLIEDNLPADNVKESYETFFVFACIWAFGSALQSDTQPTLDQRQEFSKWWQSEWKQVKFPQDSMSSGSVFDFYLDMETRTFLPWADIVPKFELDTDVPLQSTLVHTSETVRIKYFMDLLLEKGRPLMLIGSAGSGKTVLIRDTLAGLSENYAISNVPLNFYTTSEMLQRVLEKPLEKKAGRNYGPPGNKQLIYFIDDFNMPMVDTYETSQPHTLIRQHIDYNHWFDRTKIQLKDIHNVQYVASMNPTSGSFTINPRLQRHFAVFTLGFPSQECLHTIYKTILQQHLALHLPLQSPLHKTCSGIVNAALVLHGKIVQFFVPTAIKFHYVFNLRDLSNVFQGLLFSTSDCLKTPYDLVRLWLHESTRVYGDKLVDDKDIGSFQKFAYDCFKKHFDELDETMVMAKPLIYYHFASGAGDAKYMPVTDFTALQNSLVDALKTYNDFNSIMSLVLFDAAINYVCRISRIMESPRGNALLVGVGGSGKQSLARLAAFLSGLDVFQITLRKGYTSLELKTDLAALYLKAGQKNLGTMFLMTDAQVADERFLVLINDMLASGEINDLLPDDEVENVVSAMRSEVKAVGLQDTRENCWKFFIDRVRKVLKTVLCFSPVGNTLRTRSRNFPSVINSSSIVWFQEWPQEALMSVSQRFVQDIKVLPGDLLHPIATFMAYVHMSVSDMSKVYLANEKRYNYTTPKSFLEQIDLYGKLVTQKTNEAIDKANRLESGLTKLESCAEQVEELKKTLAVQDKILKEKNEKADELIKIVAEETEIVSVEKENAAKEEAKVAIVAEEVAKIQVVCQVELEKAEPALQAAYAALNTLNKTNLTELKTFTTPPGDVVLVVAAVFILWEGTRSGKLPKDKSWKATKSQMMGDIGKFLDGLQNLNKENITPTTVEALKPYISDPGFQPDLIRAKSFAASGLCSYVINVLKFNEVWQDVAPKRKALQEATDELNENLDRLKFLKGRIQELEDKLAVLTKEFEVATEAKMKCQAEADKTNATIDLANRLVGGLALEKIRWTQSVQNYRDSTITIPGDMLIVTAFVSYMGCFTKKYRIDLLEKNWLPYLHKMTPPIPMSGNVDPLTVLTDDAEISEWNTFGLPSDRMSIENATILVNSARWPLMIDPQLQGVKWIKSMYGSNLHVIRLGQKGYLDVIEDSITKGTTVLIENIMESVEPVLEPLLARNLIKKGTAIKLGDKEIDFNPKFRLILQSKLGNPHYQPEMQAQTTIINFTVTRDGLEDQLLAEVVKVERPDLESLKSQLTQQQNEFKILLLKLEGDLLSRLQTAEGDFLEDDSLVVNLETTKRTSTDVEVKAKEAVITSENLNSARELYRPAAARASLLYFILNDLNKINPIYQFSLKAFSTVFQNAIRLAVPANHVTQRVENLIDSISYSVWLYTTRGLFEKDKLIFTAQMSFQIQLQKDIIQPRDFDFLMRFPVTPNVPSPLEFLTNISWGALKSLAQVEDFRNIDRDIESSPKKWKTVVDSETPERETFPGDWKAKIGVPRLCIMRCLRPDRMMYSVSVFIEETLGNKYVKPTRVDFKQSFKETSRETPVFFILSPGVDPLKDVETLGKKLGYTIDNGSFHNVSLGQGQEIVAENALKAASKEGHWVILQNIHLVARWLPTLEKKLEQNWDNSDDNYRVFLSAEPASTHEGHIIPQGILESSIKITNEAPTGMLANVHKALDNFNQEILETCSKELEFKAILFTLCYFHAVVAERRKFGTQGWNRCYPFNTGDLTISVNVLHNYLEANTKVPWEDLRYLFGEIMYGGHITDDWDRKLCRSYLEEFMVQESLDGEIEYAPGFPAPPSTDYLGYHNYIDELLPPESPILYGLHPNAEIGFLTATSDTLFKTIFELQPRDAGGAGGQTTSKEEKMKQILDDILEKLPDSFNMNEVQARAEEKTPYVVVALQECERMNVLTIKIRRSLRELDLGLKGELTITSEMEELGNAMFMDQVPPSWMKIAYPSTLGLASWYADLLLRVRELETWSADFLLPPAVWLPGFFNPQSFLTAIMQSTARKQELPLDKMCLQCDVTKKTREEMTISPKDGACIHGLFMEGARWDILGGCLSESRLKELFAPMPVIFMKAITQDKQDNRNTYECPVYKTRSRGPHYVWTFNLRTKDRASKWVLGGVAILLQV